MDAMFARKEPKAGPDGTMSWSVDVQNPATDGRVRDLKPFIERAHQAVAAGDILVLPLPAGVRVIELVTVPQRRGPAAEAQSCYRVLDEARANLIAAREQEVAKGKIPQ